MTSQKEPIIASITRKPGLGRLKVGIPESGLYGSPAIFNTLQNRRSRSVAYAHASGLHYGKGISQPRT